jgi:hypothetical protein
VDDPAGDDDHPADSAGQVLDRRGAFLGVGGEQPERVAGDLPICSMPYRSASMTGSAWSTASANPDTNFFAPAIAPATSGSTNLDDAKIRSRSGPMLDEALLHPLDGGQGGRHEAGRALLEVAETKSPSCPPAFLTSSLRAARAGRRPHRRSRRRRRWRRRCRRPASAPSQRPGDGRRQRRAGWRRRWRAAVRSGRRNESPKRAASSPESSPISPSCFLKRLSWPSARSAATLISIVAARSEIPRSFSLGQLDLRQGVPRVRLDVDRVEVDPLQRAVELAADLLAGLAARVLLGELLLQLVVEAVDIGLDRDVAAAQDGHAHHPGRRHRS